MELYLIFSCIAVLPPLLISIIRGLPLLATCLIFIVSSVISPAIAVSVVLSVGLSGPIGSSGSNIVGLLFVFILLIFSPYALALLWPNKKEIHPDNTSGYEKGKVSARDAGMTGVCEKCGVKVSVNYGDAYQTLCKNCA